MNSDAKFWNRVAARYAKSPVADQEAYEKKLGITRRYFTPDTEVLEIGCGTGTTALIHAARVKHIRAIDIAENMIDIARDKAVKKGVTNVDFEVSSIDDLKVEDANTDMVMAHSILHLVGNRQAVIKRCFDILKPGGVFVTSTPCLKDGLGFVKFLLPILRLVGYAPSVVEFITATDLEREFTEAGFTVDHKWQPGPRKGIFMVLKKPD